MNGNCEQQQALNLFVVFSQLISLSKTSPASIRRFIAAQSALDYTYSDVGATATSLPADYALDRTRIELGQGEEVYQRARRALERWKQFALGWMEAWPADTPLRPGETVAVLIRAFELWWLNAARIVYVIDESTELITRFGFAYGTLPGHVEAGEERFLIEWDRASNRVYYDILAFSRPRHILTRMAKWQVRRMQRRFGQDSAAAMQQAVRVIHR
jgi:uncharacterized protein (UPF0548 family)